MTNGFFLIELRKAFEGFYGFYVCNIYLLVRFQFFSRLPHAVINTRVRQYYNHTGQCESH